MFHVCFTSLALLKKLPCNRLQDRKKFIRGKSYFPIKKVPLSSVPIYIVKGRIEQSFLSAHLLSFSFGTGQKG